MFCIIHETMHWTKHIEQPLQIKKFNPSIKIPNINMHKLVDEADISLKLNSVF